MRFVGRKARTHTEIDDVLLELPSRIYFSNSVRAVPHFLVLIKVKSNVSKLPACLGLGNPIFLQGDARFLRRGVKALAHDTIQRAPIDYAKNILHSPAEAVQSCTQALARRHLRNFHIAGWLLGVHGTQINQCSG